MKKVIVGNHAVSWGVKLARAEVIAAYPITPQTQVVEELSEMCASGDLKARFIKVESEHSAMAACIGASATGARAFTATSSQGLALMHELLHWAGGGRLPIVMADVNRALAPGWNVWTDQNDSLSQRDTGWIQLYCETNQEVLDTTIQAFKLAEAVDLPVMVVLDAFFLSHTSEPVDIPDAGGRGRVPAAATGADQARHERAARVRRADHAGGVHGDAPAPAGGDGEALATHWSRSTPTGAGGSAARYGPIECYRTEDAELVLVTSGTITSTARYVVNELRDDGREGRAA